LLAALAAQNGPLDRFVDAANPITHSIPASYAPAGGAPEISL
jgi:hypothetical protein